MSRADTAPQRSSLLPRGLILLAMGLFYFGLLQQLYLSSEQERQARLSYQLSSLGQNLEDLISSRLYLLNELASYVQNEPNLDQERFALITQDIFLRQPGIRSLQLAKDSVISHIAPLAGNRSVLGHNLVADSTRDLEARLAIDQRSAVLAGPLDLIQGGRGLAIRSPIFVYRSPDLPERYWGLAIVLLDWAQLIKESDLPGIANEYQVALRQQDHEGHWQPAFYGEDSLFTAADSEEILLQLPGTSWALAIRSRLSSTGQLPLAGYAIGLLLLLASAYLLFCLSYTDHALAPPAFALSFVLLALILIGFDSRDRQSRQQITLSHALSLQNDRIRDRLLAHQHFLQHLANPSLQQMLSAPLFEERARRQLRESAELVALLWLTPDRRIYQQIERSGPSVRNGEKLMILESQKAAQKAQGHHRAEFTAPFQDHSERYRFDLWQPLYQGQKFLGLLGVRIDCQTLLEQSVEPYLLGQYRLRLRNRGDLEFARLQDPELNLGQLSAMLSQNPPGQGVTLELTRYQERWSLLSLMLLVLLLAMGVATVLQLYRLRQRYLSARTDLDRHQQTGGQLAREHRLLQTTLSSIGEGVITTDADGLVQRINPIAEALCQCSQDEARGQPLFSVLRLQDNSYAKPLRQRLQEALEQARQQQQTQWLNGTLVDRNTELHSVRCTIAPILHDERFQGDVIIIHDLSGIQAMGRRLEFRERSEAHAPLGSDEFELCCKEALIHARETGYQHLLLYLDLDLEHSTLTADEDTLQALELPLYHLIRQHLRQQDPIARLGGQRFALLLRYCSVSKGQKIAREIIQALKDPGIIWTHSANRPRLALNIGLICITRGSADYSTLCTQADQACYIAKSQGPNHCYQSPVDCLEQAHESALEPSSQRSAPGA